MMPANRTLAATMLLCFSGTWIACDACSPEARERERQTDELVRFLKTAPTPHLDQWLQAQSRTTVSAFREANNFGRKNGASLAPCLDVVGSDVCMEHATSAEEYLRLQDDAYASHALMRLGAVSPARAEELRDAHNIALVRICDTHWGNPTSIEKGRCHARQEHDMQATAFGNLIGMELMSRTGYILPSQLTLAP